MFCTKKLPYISLLLLLTACNFYNLQSNPVYVTRSSEYHIVRQGDTLYSISRQYSISVDRLKLFNSLEEDRIFVGQKIYLTPNQNDRTEFVTQRPIPTEGFHVVRKGETVYRISKMYDLEIIDIIEFNNLSSFTIYENQKIWLIPKEQTAAEVISKSLPVDDKKEDEIHPEPVTEKKDTSINYHIVQRGENLYRISLRYGMTLGQLKELNRLDSDHIYVGQRLIVTGDAKPVTEVERVRTSVAFESTDTIYLPLNGRVVSEFGIRNNIPHNGIDIAAPIGEPIHAALNGKVVFSGTQRGYGNVIVLEHDNYIMTVYAHNERNLVRLGETVSRGQPIATVGQSGNATGPHLHFEYRVRGKAINPREVLKGLD